MAKYIVFDRALFGVDGMIPLNRGDDWVLPGKVIVLNGRNQDDADLSAVSGSSGFLPADGGGTIPVQVEIVDAMCGKVKLTVPKTDSVSAALSDSGITPYVILQDQNGLNTIGAIEPSLTIKDRGFGSF